MKLVRKILDVIKLSKVFLGIVSIIQNSNLISYVKTTGFS